MKTTLLSGRALLQAGHKNCINLLKRSCWIVPVAIAFLASPAHATLYSDIDVFNTTLSASNPSRTGSFDIASKGYESSTESILWAGFAFTFYDSDNREDTVEINLGHEAVNYEHIARGFSIFGGLLAGDALLDLSSDGFISYTIRWESGDPFRLVAASLLAESSPITVATAPSPTNRVPDGGATAGLLGCALLGLVWTGKRLQFVKVC
jgi:hypothetical protein